MPEEVSEHEKAMTVLAMMGWPVGQEVAFNGAPHNPYRLTAYSYDYEEDKSTCKACGNVGIAWRGWLTCEYCPAITFIPTGQVFLPSRLTNAASAPLRFGIADKDPYEGCGWEPEFSKESS